MHHFSPQIRLSTTFSFTLLQGVNLNKWNKRVKVGPDEMNFASVWFASGFTCKSSSYTAVYELSLIQIKSVEVRSEFN